MTDEIEKISTPRGDALSMLPLSPRDMAYHNAAPGAGADWMGPSPPIQPIAPPEVAGRTWDFTPGYNLATQPRAFEEIGFAELRALASAYDPIRLIIERRKDQMARLPWSIRQKHEGATKRPHPSSQMRSMIRDVTDFFRHPMAEMNFRSWLRSLLEDVLVYDAPSLFCERDANGNLVELPVIDGTTIKRIVDDKGRAPRPFRYDGGNFDWLGRMIGAADLDANGFKFVNGLLYPPGFQQILKGMPAVNLTTWDLMYRPMNLRPRHIYGFSPVAQILTTISIAMRRSYSQLEYFREGNVPAGIVGLPVDWGPDKVQQFQDFWDNLFVGDLGRRRQMRFVAGDGKYQALHEPPLKSEFDEYLLRICCLAFSYPVSALVREENRATADKHEKQAEEEGIEPLKNWVSDTLNEIIEREFSDELEFAWAEEDEVDQKIQSEILGNYVGAGILTRNEARQKLGEELDPNPNANRLMITTSQGVVPLDDDADNAGDADADEQADKLAKGGAIIMRAPQNWKPRARFSLGGTTYLPDVKKRQLVVYHEDDVLALEGHGWARQT